MRLFIQKTPVILFVILMAAAGWKILLLAMDVMPFNSDEAVVALMARHILAGARPIFFYGQAYMGSLDAYLVSFGFAIFGQKVAVIRLVQTLLYLSTIITTVLIARRIFGSHRVGLLAAVLMAVPTVNVTLYTTVSLGGYGEALLIGNLLLLVGLQLIEARQENRAPGFRYGLAFCFSLLTGLGLWANGLTLVFAVPVGIAWLWSLWQSRTTEPVKVTAGLLLSAVLGFFAGSAPWWVHAIQVGWTALLAELFGSAVAVESSPWILRILAHLFNFLVLGLPAVFGLRPPWEVRWLALPLMPLALAFWFAVIAFFIRQAVRQNPHRSAYRILLGIVLAVTAGFILTPFGVDPSGRYFLPLTMPLALAAAHMVTTLGTKARWQAAIIAMIVIFNGWGTLQSALRYPPGITTQFDQSTAVDHRYDAALMQFLRNRDERTGYSQYWVTYPLAFQSEEQLIFAPRLPYHQDMRYTERDDRYPAYTHTAAEGQRTAYISARNAALEDYLRREFTRLDIEWLEEQIGDYQVFYGLSRAVHPEEIGLGRSSSFRH